MNESYEKIFHRLLASTPLKARVILREIEEDPLELERFCRQSNRLQAGRAMLLCPILSTMFSAEFMGLLQNYALSSDTELSATAFHALEKANITARRDTLIKLLETGSDKIKIRVCEILADEGGEDAGRVLSSLLDDSSDEVISAALESILEIEQISFLDECEKFLFSSNEKIRTATLNLYEKWNENIPQKAILEIVQSDTSDKVRVLAIHVLHNFITPNILEVLLTIIQNPKEPSQVRCEVAQALSNIADIKVGLALFKICSKEMSDFKLIQLARTSIIKIPEEILYTICSEVFKSDAVMGKLEATRIAGIIATPLMKNFLSQQLKNESNDIVLSALLEESAKLNNPECWSQAILLLGEGPVISYAAAQALALLVNPNNLEEFSQILKGKHDKIIYEVILERLASYGKARGIPWDLAGCIEEFLTHDYANIAVLAAEAASYVSGGALVGALLDAIGNTDRNEVNHALCVGIMQAANNSLTRLLNLAGGKRLLKLAAVISYMDDQIFADKEFFINLASLAGKNVESLHLCLILSARTNIPEFVQAFESCRGEALVALLNAWKSLPHGLRLLHKLNWVRLLTIEDSRVRLLTLKAISTKESQNYIDYISDIVFLDPNPNIQKTATKVLQEALTLPPKERIGIL